MIRKGGKLVSAIDLNYATTQADVQLKPILSIIIVNSDGLQDTLACLASIYQHPPQVAFEVVVVDNCSREPCLPTIGERFPQVRRLMAAARQGFAKNYNQGLRVAGGDYLLVLNNDTLISAGALDVLLEALRAEPDYAMVGPRLVGRDGVIQPVCARDLPTPLSYLVAQVLLDAGLPLGRLWQRWLVRQGTRRRSGPVPCISGACMLLRRSDLEKVGLLDEGFDFYYEDVEWCHRFQSYDKKVGFVAEVTITHVGDQSLSRVKVWAKRSEYLSAQRYFTHYYCLSERQQYLIWLATSFNYLMRGLIMLLAEALDKQTRYAREYILLWRWLLTQRPNGHERD
ncbi:MAG: glycosyltransferase family 2 protein [Candidatus Viridilinea halotolerans]|uniref:Glycosyltransferase family 2 protein n=1 Tax=Candidatus Viridilinea halotolerans TaxID=2491704 RepID=A0A426UAN5_9CHLR|nr:MAG: glycosyltransferase family 2 protein [Candidatus Viridilinea halotolerans]